MNAEKNQLEALLPRNSETGLVDLRALAEQNRLQRRLQNTDKKSNINEGVTGGREPTPSPNLEVPNDELREQFKQDIDKLTDTEFAKLRSLVQRSVLSRAFGLVVDTVPVDNSLPADPPALWKKRETGREVSPMDWVRQHYGAINPDGSWSPQGLKRTDLRHDMPLYRALVKWLKRHPEDDFDPEGSRTISRYDDPSEAVERIRAQKRASEKRLRP